MPTKNFVSKTGQYFVRDGDQVTIDVIIGLAQVGGSALVLDGVELASGKGFVAYPLGTGSALRGKTLFVLSAVTDVRSQTNDLLVDHYLKGGPQTLNEPIRMTVTDKESGRFELEVRFV